MAKKDFIEGVHYYLEDGFLVMTEQFHKERGFCCGKVCRHCPFITNVKGTTELKKDLDKA